MSFTNQQNSGTETGFWILVSVMALIALLLAWWYSFALFHTLAELGTIIVILSACSIALNSRHLVQNGYLLVLSIGFSAYAVIILLHLLTYKGVGIFEVTADVPTQLWIAGRYLLAATFLLAGRYLTRPAPLTPLIIGYGAVTAAALLAIMYCNLFPACFIEGTGLTPFKKLSEIVIAGMFGLALAGLYRNRQKLNETVVRLVSAMLICFIVSELCFIVYNDVFGIANAVGHVVNLGGFALYHHVTARIAVVDPYSLIFRELAQLNAKLEKRVQERTAQVYETSMFLRESQKIARVGGWKCNPETGMLFWTDELYTLLECPADLLLSYESGLAYFAPEHRAMFQEQVMQAWQENRPFTFECRLIPCTGREFWAEIRCHGRRAEHEGECISGTLQDISVRKEVEQTLIAAKEEAQAISKAKQEFLGAISHELRTPLNGIIGGIQLIGMTELNKEQHEYQEIVSVSANRELALVNDLLELTCIEAGTLRMVAEPFAVRETLNSLVLSHRIECQEKGISLTVSFDENLVELLIGDGERLKQLVGILLSNAVKFTNQGSIELSVCTVDLKEQGPGVAITVADSGIGIPAEMLNRIFDPFVQVDMSHTRIYGGTGLGLAICQRLCRLMGGSVTVQSVVGQGSCFRLELPFGLASVADTRWPVGDDAPAAHKKLKIMLVEDDPVNKIVTGIWLQRQGHEVVHAEEGAQGVTLWRQGDYDLILMDLLLPVMDGVEAMLQIRREEAGCSRHTPIVVLTADTMRHSEADMLAAGFDGYLTKPVDMKALAEAVQRMAG